jgi:hypothetical protein
MITINGEQVTAKEFAWDTCHKIYLINTPEDRKQLLEYEYDLFPIEDLKECYENSCGLRFISNGDLQHSPSEQGNNAIIKEF